MDAETLYSEASAEASDLVGVVKDKIAAGYSHSHAMMETMALHSVRACFDNSISSLGLSRQDADLDVLAVGLELIARSLVHFSAEEAAAALGAGFESVVARRAAVRNAMCMEPDGLSVSTGPVAANPIDPNEAFEAIFGRPVQFQ